jgi:ParB family transcriptional regulator, chromosome partitioning protein
MTEPSRRLGRGLSALLGDTAPQAAQAAVAPGRALRLVPIADIAPGRAQPRQSFSQAALKELAESIRTHGVLQPVLLRRHADDPAKFELIAGERRWRAAQAAGVHEIPAIIRDLTDREALEVALIENLQRQDLNAVEEAEGFKRLIDEFAYTQEELANTLGKSRPHLTNLLRILALPASVLDLVRNHAIEASHAKALLAAKDPAALAARVAADGLSVRETERLARESHGPAKPARQKLRDANIADLERRITGKLGCAAQVTHKPGGKSTLTLRFSNLEQLQDVLARLGVA